MMRVLHVIDSLELAGAERSLAAMVPALWNHGVGGWVAHFGRDAGLTSEIEASGLQVVKLAGPTRRTRFGQLSTLVARVQPDLVHTTLFEADIVGRLAARRHRIPVVSSLVTMQYSSERQVAEQLPSWKVAAARAMDAGTAQFVTRFHAITEAAASHASRRLHAGRTPIEIIPRGRSDSALGRRDPQRRRSVREALGWNDGEAVLLAVARQVPAKGLDVLVDAGARLRQEGRNVRMVLAGRQDTASPLIARRVDELGLSRLVEQLGVRHDVADLMVGADLLVLPSRWEGLGGVLIEAMALELPIVASDLEPIAEAAPRGEVALLATPGDPGLLAEAIATSLSDPSAARARAVCGRARFEAHYTIEAVAGQMAAFYRRALGQEDLGDSTFRGRVR